MAATLPEMQALTPYNLIEVTLTGAGVIILLAHNPQRWSVQFFSDGPTLTVAPWPIDAGLSPMGFSFGSMAPSTLFKFQDYLSLVGADWYINDTSPGAHVRIIETQVRR